MGLATQKKGEAKAEAEAEQQIVRVWGKREERKSGGIRGKWVAFLGSTVGARIAKTQLADTNWLQRYEVFCTKIRIVLNGKHLAETVRELRKSRKRRMGGMRYI